MAIDFEFHIDLDRLVTAEQAVTPEALGKAMEHIRGVAAEQTPIETGHLVGTAAVHVNGNEASITYDGPYARYQHERMDLRHPHGNAKFLELPMVTEKDKAMQIIATDIARAL
jgi:hypothetical protein